MPRDQSSGPVGSSGPLGPAARVPAQPRRPRCRWRRGARAAAAGAVLLSVACACSAPLWGLFAADRDRQRLNDRWERHGNIRHELILLRLERPGAGAPAPEGAAADRRYQALCAELIQVVNEYNGIRERHPDWGVPRLTAEMKE